MADEYVPYYLYITQPEAAQCPAYIVGNSEAIRQLIKTLQASLTNDESQVLSVLTAEANSYPVHVVRTEKESDFEEFLGAPYARNNPAELLEKKIKIGKNDCTQRTDDSR